MEDSCSSPKGKESLKGSYSNPALQVIPGRFHGRCSSGWPASNRQHSPLSANESQEGWQVVAQRKRWRRLARQAPPPLALRRIVPTDLVGLCFNCLRLGHVVIACTNASRCLRCHR
jgi:hypothetical protein